MFLFLFSRGELLVYNPGVVFQCIKMGGMIGKADAVKHATQVSKLEAEMVNAMQRRAAEGSSMKSFNSLILKFPKIDENLRKCRSIFQQFGESFNFITSC